MFLLVVLLVFIAALAYFMGSLNTLIIASHLIYHRNMLAYAPDNIGITRFFKDTNRKQNVMFLGMEILKVFLPILIGGWLMSIYDIPETGRAFAMLCLLLGNNFSAIYGLKGKPSLIPFGLAALAVDAELGIGVIGSFLLMYFITRYISLSAISAAFIGWVLSIIAIDITMVSRILLVCFAIVVIEYRKSIINLIKGTEPKFRYKKDLSYMFDE